MQWSLDGELWMQWSLNGWEVFVLWSMDGVKDVCNEVWIIRISMLCCEVWMENYVCSEVWTMRSLCAVKFGRWYVWMIRIRMLWNVPYAVKFGWCRLCIEVYAMRSICNVKFWKRDPPHNLDDPVSVESICNTVESRGVFLVVRQQLWKPGGRCGRPTRW